MEREGFLCDKRQHACVVDGFRAHHVWLYIFLCYMPLRGRPALNTALPRNSHLSRSTIPIPCHLYPADTYGNVSFETRQERGIGSVAERRIR